METPRNRRTWPTYPDIALEYGHAMPDALGTGQDNMSNLSWADEFVIEGQWNDRDQDMRLWSNEFVFKAYFVDFNVVSNPCAEI